jgi:sulfur carrier protein
MPSAAGPDEPLDARPPGAQPLLVNGQPRAIPTPPTVAGLLRELGLSDQPAAVEVNRRLIPKRQHDQATLSAGDSVEVVTLVGGG